MVSCVGLLGILCSVMIYHDTRRPFWIGPSTALRFFGTTVLLGTGTILLLTTLQTVVAPEVAGHRAYHALTDRLAEALVLATALKLAFEISLFRHLHAAVTSPLQGTASLMAGELKEITTARFLLGAIGGAVLPIVFLIQKPAPGWATLGLTIWLLVFVLFGEMLERRLFFSAVVAPGMPGSI
jgi:DMSO reductase anchor subunit